MEGLTTAIRERIAKNGLTQATAAHALRDAYDAVLALSAPTVPVLSVFRRAQAWNSDCARRFHASTSDGVTSSSTASARESGPTIRSACAYSSAVRSSPAASSSMRASHAPL